MRVPEDHPPAFFLDMEKVHGGAQLAVIAPLGLLDARQVLGQIGVGRPGCAVNPLQLGVALIASPIGAGQLGELERLAHMPRRGQVRPPAQVLPRSLAIDRDRLVAGNVADDLRLVFLADPLEMGDGLAAIPHLAGDRLVAIDDLAHPRLDLAQVVQGKRFGAGEVVIEPVLDVGADSHLRVGEQLLHRLRQHVRGVVADDLQGLGAIAGDDLQRAAAFQRPLQVDQVAVQLQQQGLLGQRRRDRGGHLRPRHPIVELALLSVGKFQFDHRLVFHGPGAPGHSRSRRADGICTGAGRRAMSRAPGRAGPEPPPHSPNRSAESGTGARSTGKASPYRPDVRPGWRCGRGSCRRARG